MWRNAGIVVVGALATAQGDGATLMVTLPPGAIDAVEGPVEVWDDLTGGCVVARSIELDVLVCTQVRVDLTASRIGRPIVYKGANGFSIAISKSGELQVPEDPTLLWGGRDVNVILNETADILGNALLGRGGDPIYDDIAALVPPVLSSGGDAYDYELVGQTFIGSRIAAEKRSFGLTGRMNNLDIEQRFHLDDAQLSLNRTRAGLLGDFTPALRWNWSLPGGKSAEQIVFAIPESSDEFPFDVSSIQPIWTRFVNVSSSGLRYAHYVNTFEQYPYYCSNDTVANISFPTELECNGGNAVGFYTALFKFMQYWNRTWTVERAMDLKLPVHGVNTAAFAKHSVTRMMITRRDLYHPRYGTPPLYYASCCDGFQDVFASDMAVYLEWNFLDTARGVFDNYFSFYVRRNATVNYRGPEIAQYGRTLTLIAQYYRLTGDTTLLLKHSAKIVDFSNMLISRRRTAQRLPKSDPSHGMIRGDDESDEMFSWRRKTSELPHFSFTLEAWRGFRDLGPVWVYIGGKTNRPDLVAVGEALVNETESMMIDIERAMNASVVMPSGSPITYTASKSATIPSRNPTDWSLSGSMFVPSLSADSLDIRTGTPGQQTNATLAHPIVSQGHEIVQVSLTFEYVAGYFIKKDPTGLPTVALVVVDPASQQRVATLWTSEPLGNWSFDNFTGYSPTVRASATAAIPGNHCVQLALVFENKKHNLQLRLDSIDVNIRWSPVTDGKPSFPCASASGPPCHPYVAGEPTCSDMGASGAHVSNTTAPYNGRASEPWRTYSGMFYSGGLRARTITDIVQFNQNNSQLAHVGIWSGVGGFRNQFMSFTEQGHGYGLIQHDLVEHFLLQLFSEMAHVCTRGTWTCFESRGIPNWTPGGGYTTPSQSIVPLHTKWMLAWEDPVNFSAVTLCKATPRSWLQPGEVVAVQNAVLSVGHFTFNISAKLGPVVEAAVEYLPSTTDLGLGLAQNVAVTLKLRVPQGWSMKSVIVNGAGWSKFNGVAETIELPLSVQSTKVTAQVTYNTNE